MRLAKLCVTLLLASGGWHSALAASLCALRADCRAHAPSRAAHAQHGRAAQHDSPRRANESAPGGAHRVASHAPAERANPQGHCGSPAESERAAAHGTLHDAAPAAAAGATGGGEESVERAAGGEERAGESVRRATAADLRAPASPCEHCAAGRTEQPERANSVAPAFARDAHAADVPSRCPAAFARPAARARLAPTEHSPPRARPLHLLNSVLLI